MRHESSTVIAVVGRPPAGLLSALAESGNVSVVRVGESDPSGAAGPTLGDPGGTRRPTGPDGSAAPAAPLLATWEPGARALREAARRRATYVVVAGDPLSGLASAWRARWDVTSDGEPAGHPQVAGARAVVAAARRADRCGPQVPRWGPCRETAGPV